MARKGREAALKRAREKARQEKREAKQERRLAREPDDEGPATEIEEQALMEEFARLSERHESNQITTEKFNEERTRIFTELGIESGD
ncbi:MAG TPA: hypothetical protein VJ948_07785 [Acidimicrobiia bacterium]|nr:hypothetical protein [Acidimicrobiia bacterium]